MSFEKVHPDLITGTTPAKVTLPMFICSAKDRLLLIFSFALSPVHLFFGQMILSHGDVDQKLRIYIIVLRTMYSTDGNLFLSLPTNILHVMFYIVQHPTSFVVHKLMEKENAADRTHTIANVQLAMVCNDCTATMMSK